MVSIGVPVYGVERYIERCARSLFEQTYEDLEIIFVDDCTPDNSIGVLRKVMEQYPQRKSQIQIVKHEHNLGLAAARNTAVEHATGDFLIWVDSDDYIDHTLVEQCVKKQQESNCDIVLFDFTILHNNRNEIMRHVRCNTVHERTVKLLARQTPVCIWGGFYRLSLYKENDLKAVEGVNNNEDYQVSPRLSYYSRTIAYIDNPLYYYDCSNNTSITHNFNYKYANQGWMSVEILIDFFKGKGQEYMDAIHIASLNRVATYLKWSIKVDNRDYYNEMRNKQHEMGMVMANTVPLSHRIYLHMKSYAMLKIYTKLGVLIKHYIKQ